MSQPACWEQCGGYSSEDEKIFAFGLLPSKLAFILPSRAFCFLHWRANGDLNSTQPVRRVTTRRDGDRSVVRPAPGADEWGIDKIDRAWLT